MAQVPLKHLQGLNAAQREAVATSRGPMLVLAGAGTGKTRVITCRMAELIRLGTPPDQILSVTFTNKAAREMLVRTREIIGGRLPSRPWISTFHALCVNILRNEIEHLGYPSRFTIVDRGDQESIARSVLRDIRVTEKSLRPGDFLSVISRWKSAGVEPGAAADVADDDQQFLAALGFRRYQQKLRSSGAVDFDDLLLLTGQLFREFPDVLERQQQRFQHVQIDEYQDTNRVQFDLVQALVAPHHNLCVVGDDDQSIYGWRGAEVEHILRFTQYFPEARVVRLEENYRCTRPILEVANRLVRHNRNRHVKELRPNKTGADEVRFLDYPDEQQEAELIVREIRFHHQQKGVPLRNVAILFRTNEQPRVFEAELRRAGLRYVLLGSQSFFDRREVRDLLAYLKVIASPGDENSLLRIINTPARGIGDTTVERILNRAVRDGRSFRDSVANCRSEGLISDKAAIAVVAFFELLDRFGARMEQQPDQLEDHVGELIEAIGYEAELERQYKDPQQRLARAAVIEDFLESIREYRARSRDPSLRDFLTDCALDGRQEEPDKEAEAEQDAVKLMTLHSAKGLEFPWVYLVGLEEGLLPHRRSVDATAREIEEERRLTYVGVTRAQDRLAVTRAAHRRKWGKLRPSPPSRFLFEMRGEGGVADEDQPLEPTQAETA